MQKDSGGTLQFHVVLLSDAAALPSAGWFPSRWLTVYALERAKNTPVKSGVVLINHSYHFSFSLLSPALTFLFTVLPVQFARLLRFRNPSRSLRAGSCRTWRRFPNPARKLPLRASIPVAGTPPRFPARFSPHSSTITFIPSPCTAKTTAPASFPRAWSTPRTGIRTIVRVPRSYKGRHVWLNFDGINYSAGVWVNGAQVGTIRGAFIRGIFDITALVKPGHDAVVAVLVTPQPHPGVPHEHNLRNGVGKNGGISAIDGPTFLSTIGWDWLQPFTIATRASGRRSISPQPAGGAEGSAT